jgi:hypothetical protein
MKVKTSELTRNALNWAVAQCLGFECHQLQHRRDMFQVVSKDYFGDWSPHYFNPAYAWVDGGSIIDREDMALNPINHRNGIDKQEARLDHMGFTFDASGPTKLIAAMRCLVLSRKGEEVEIPDELCN